MPTKWRRQARQNPQTGALSFLSFASFAEGLASRVDSVADRLFLAADRIFAALHPFIHGVTRFAPAMHHVLAAFLRAAHDGLARLTSGAGSIQHAHERAKTQSRQEPHEVTSTISVRH